MQAPEVFCAGAFHDEPDLVSGVHAETAAKPVAEDNPVRPIAKVPAFPIIELGEEAALGRVVIADFAVVRGRAKRCLA